MLDLGRPIMSGYEVARALRSARAPCTLVAITGFDHDAARRQARDAGFDHHLVKPVSESALIELLARIAAIRAANR
jgi:CheY-like chemotaxis protein